MTELMPASLFTKKSLRLALFLLPGMALAACSETPTSNGPFDVPVVDNDAQTPTDAQTPNDLATTDAAPPADAPAADAGVAPATRVAIPAYGFNPQRTSANRNETQLTVAALMADRLGRDTAFAPSFDGEIYTQPLYMPQLTVNGAAHDVLFVATQANSVYAVDAATGAELWRTGLGAPVPRSTQPCGNITGTTGVLGGPVIDPATNTLYAVAATRTGSSNGFTINALDLVTGMQRSGYPAPIAPPAVGASTWSATAQQERGALAFINGRIYVPFGGLWGDCGNYHGWVVGIDPANPSSQTAWATPGRGSAIWAPAGISSDGTHLYAATGNDFLSGSTGVSSNWVVRLGTGPMGPTLAPGTAEYFQPSNYRALDQGDVDLGSAAPIVLPDHAGSSTPHLLFEGGKQGVVYLINRDNLGGRGTGNGTSREAVFSQQISNIGIFGAFASWSDGTDTFVFAPVNGQRPTCPSGGSAGVIAMRLNLTGTASSLATAWCTPSITNSTPAVSSNGNADGVLWVAGGTTTLRAFRISDGMQLVNLSEASSVRKWVPPVIADGRVFVTGRNTVSMFRLVR